MTSPEPSSKTPLDVSAHSIQIAFRLRGRQVQESSESRPLTSPADQPGWLLCHQQAGAVQCHRASGGRLLSQRQRRRAPRWWFPSGADMKAIRGFPCAWGKGQAPLLDVCANGVVSINLRSSALSDSPYPGIQAPTASPQAGIDRPYALMLQKRFTPDGLQSQSPIRGPSRLRAHGISLLQSSSTQPPSPFDMAQRLRFHAPPAWKEPSWAWWRTAGATRRHTKLSGNYRCLSGGFLGMTLCLRWPRRTQAGPALITQPLLRPRTSTSPRRRWPLFPELLGDCRH